MKGDFNVFIKTFGSVAKHPPPTIIKSIKEIKKSNPYLPQRKIT